MRRREFISRLGSAAAWPLAVRAQIKPAVVGWLNVRPRNRAAATEAFVAGLREGALIRSWHEGADPECPLSGRYRG